jgi:hypothetical protein
MSELAGLQIFILVVKQHVFHELKASVFVKTENSVYLGMLTEGHFF